MRAQKISLIVTVKNDAETLRQLQHDVEQQTLQPHEVILSVASSSDSTLSVAQAWAKDSKIVQVLEVGSANRSVGRNRAVAESTSELLVFTDAGCRFESSWLSEISSPFSQSGVELVSGLTIGAPENDWEAAQVPFTLVLPQDIAENPLPATRNMAVRRETFDRVGGFREDLTWGAEDFEWSRRAVTIGVKPVFAKDAIVHWRPRTTHLGFWKMLHSLTLGDVQADTWRWGHASMVGRYGFFGGVGLISLPISSLFWASYICLKAHHTSKKAKTKWLETVQAQVLADTAVLSGVLRGVWHTFRTKDSQ